MAFRYVVLGAGMQGTAAAFDLARSGEAEWVRVFDRDPELARRAAARVSALVPAVPVTGAGLEVDDAAALASALAGAHGVLSALPYRLNPVAAEGAVRSGASFCDLGGNTAIVRETLGLAERARLRGVSVVPDCGLAPGLGNMLAAEALRRFPDLKHLHVRCGGLPETPRGPLGYKLVFHIGGLTNEYSGFAECLREGKRTEVPALEEVEVVEFPPPLGALEAFTTSGGTSTCCETWAGRLLTYDYKTLRYPGHLQAFRLLRDLGFLDERPMTLSGASVRPRDLLHALLVPRLSFQDDRDLVLLRVVGEDLRGVERLRFDLFDRHDEATGFSAMERTTAFPAAATLHLQVRGEVPAGANTPERVVPPDRLLAAVRARGLVVRESAS